MTCVVAIIDKENNKVIMGADYALGAIFSCEESNPELDVLSALQAAQYFSAGVSEPFNILST